MSTTITQQTEKSNRMTIPDNARHSTKRSSSSVLDELDITENNKKKKPKLSVVDKQLLEVLPPLSPPPSPVLLPTPESPAINNTAFATAKKRRKSRRRKHKKHKVFGTEEITKGVWFEENVKVTFFKKNDESDVFCGKTTDKINFNRKQKPKRIRRKL